MVFKHIFQGVRAWEAIV